jgi:hypothetical protein
MANESNNADKSDPALAFEEVLKAEEKAGCSPPGASLGLAFSGGGIRSATFNLGVIQALAKLEFLRHFDYLSTISGGGYIGGWLSTFIKRLAGGDVGRAEELIRQRDGPLENAAIRFLRSFSNYLTPRMGLSMDTLIAVATYLRNLLLNLAILVTLAGALLILPRFAARLENSLAGWSGFDGMYEWIVVAVLVLPTYMVALNLLFRPADRAVSRPWFMRRNLLIALVDLPVLAAAFVVTSYYVRAAVNKTVVDGWWFLSVLGLYVVLWIIGVVLAVVFRSEARGQFARFGWSAEHAKWHGIFLVFAVIAGAIGAGILVGVAKLIVQIPEAHRLFATAAFGPPAVISAILLMVVVHIGMMGRNFVESDRELWSVFGARLIAIAVAWAIVFAIAIYGPATLDWANDWVIGLGGGAWIASTLFGVFSGKSEASGKPESKAWIEALTRIAPYVFAVGLLVALSWGLHRALIWGNEVRGGAMHETLSEQNKRVAPRGIRLHADPTPGTPVVTVREIGQPGLWEQFLAHARNEYGPMRQWFAPGWAMPLMVLLMALCATGLSWRVNINLFSLHHFYRNRLARCYLGATNDKRRPHPLTGFDPDDDVPMAQLRGQKPFHIVGTAINLNRGRQLAWQNRRAASFTFTPLHAGYEPASRQVGGGYRESADYGKDADEKPIPLGTAIAISGAAASPNQGFHTSPAVAFLMTVFNVRLGHWCGDTRHPNAWQARDPLFSLRYWLAELTGSADQDYPFVSLSDGGHFENLGVYELVRRRCGLILACDAGADPDYGFEDLAEAMRKCYTDFGVEIKFDGKFKVDDIRPQGDNHTSKRHYAIGEINYPGRNEPGILIYLKSSLTDNLPADIMHYRRTHGDFPHESTADQFFDEAQFESYRKLGFEAAMRSFDAMRGDGELPPPLGPVRPNTGSGSGMSIGVGAAATAARA